ncbi:MAG: hypothetical protein JWQ96_206 [Segetibacter sp.]|nr:hypothetical protein [Segetibacter sp.]
MKTLITILIFYSLSLPAFAQKDSLLKTKLLFTYHSPVTNFTTDNLGNIYIISPTNQIKKINEKGDSIAVYNDVRRYGKLYSVDATNPLKTLAYYRDFSTLIVLDRLLNVRNTIDLRQQNIFQVKVACISYDNNVWVYDEADSKIKKIDETGKILLESNDLRQVFDNVPSPEYIYDRDGQLYLYDPKKGLYTFDYYGGFKSKVALLGIQDFQVFDKNTITGSDSTSFLMYKPGTLQLLTFKAFKNPHFFKRIVFAPNRIYALNKKEQLAVYSIL